jgi:hypothetical protein
MSQCDTSVPGEIDQYGDAIMNSRDYLRPEFIADSFAAAGTESKDETRYTDSIG